MCEDSNIELTYKRKKKKYRTELRNGNNILFNLAWKIQEIKRSFKVVFKVVNYNLPLARNIQFWKRIINLIINLIINSSKKLELFH